jgi:hypothetical protein
LRLTDQAYVRQVQALREGGTDMNIHIGGRPFLVAAILGAVAVLAVGLFVALAVRSVVAGPGAGPAASPPNPGHSWSEVGDLPGTMWHSNNDGSGSGLDADTLDGLQSTEIQDGDDYVSNAGYCATAGDADTLDSQHDSFYRDASNIDAGTLGTSYYSAHSDLNAEGYLDNDANGDLLTRAQADERFVNEGQSDSVMSAMIEGGAVGLSKLDLVLVASSDGIWIPPGEQQDFLVEATYDIGGTYYPIYLVSVNRWRGNDGLNQQVTYALIHKVEEDYWNTKWYLRIKNEGAISAGVTYRVWRLQQ